MELKNNNHLLYCFLFIVSIIFLTYYIAANGYFKPSPIVNVKAENCYDSTLNVLSTDGYIPYTFTDKMGKPTGHDVELINIIANRLQKNVNFRFAEWNEAIDEVKTGKSDILLTCEFYNPNSKESELDQTICTVKDDFTVFGKEKITDYVELFSKRVGAMKNGNVSSSLMSIGLFEHCTPYNTNEEIFEAIANGTCDYAVMRNTVGKEILKVMQMDNIKPYLSIGPSYICFGVSSENTALKEALNRTLIELQKDGTLKKLNSKWLTTFVKPYSIVEVVERFPLLGIIFLIVCVTFLFLAYFARKAEYINAQQSSIISELSNDFEYVSFVKTENGEMTNKVTPLRITGRFLDVSKVWMNEPLIENQLKYFCETLVFPEDQNHFMKMMSKEVIMEKLNNSSSHIVEYRLVDHGKFYYYQTKLVKGKFNDNGIVVAFRSIDEDVRNKMKQQEALSIALQMANAASKAKTAFLSNMSHDIRTPMNAIIGYTNMGLKYYSDKTKVREYLSKVSDVSKHLLSLVDDVLDLSHIESGRLTLSEKQENIVSVMDNLRSMAVANASQKHQKFTLKAEGIVHKVVFFDKLKLNQILLNIISNSIKYTPENGEISLIVSEKQKISVDHSLYEFIVKDNGIGMSKDFLQKVFEPFTRARSSTDSGVSGCGLGLTIVQNLIKLMNGKIEIKSDENCGTEVSVIFDFKFSENDVADDLSPKVTSIEDFKAKLNGKRVLLVDDNEVNREIAEDILMELGFVVDTADDGTTALEKVKNAKLGDYDVILMDIQMPIMNGFEATRQIRHLDNPLSNIPIVALTANAFAEDRIACIDAGMNEHIAKPIEVMKLASVLASVL